MRYRVACQRSNPDFVEKRQSYFLTENQLAAALGMDPNHPGERYLCFPRDNAKLPSLEDHQWMRAFLAETFPVGENMFFDDNKSLYAVRISDETEPNKELGDFLAAYPDGILGHHGRKYYPVMIRTRTDG